MKKIIILLMVSASWLRADSTHSTTVEPSQIESHSTRAADGAVVTDSTITTHIRQVDKEGAPVSIRAAIFINNRAGQKYDGAMTQFEDMITGKVTERGVEILSREVVTNSMRSYSAATNSTQGPTDLDTQLTDNSSALHLAQGLGADYLLVASIASVGTKQRAINGYGVKEVLQDTTLRCSYKILDGHTGGSIAGDSFAVTESTHQSESSVEANDDIINSLLDQAAAKLADSLGRRVASHRIREASVAASMVDFTINTEGADLMIEDIRIDADRTVSIADNKLKVAVLGATIELDGVALGTTPATIQVTPGFHKLRITRTGYEAWERTINAAKGQSLVVALRLTEAQYARWKDATVFVTGLKNGAKLTDAEVEKLRGEAKMLSESGFKVDTKQAPATNIFR